MIEEDTLKMLIPSRPIAAFPASTGLPFVGSRPEGRITPPSGLLPTSKFAVVLVDSPTLQKIVGTILSREGYELQFFRNGIEAMKCFACPGSRTPDLMLVDLVLPKINGYEVIQRFKAKPRFNQTVCIILASRDSSIDNSKGKLAGAATCIKKPFTSEELLAKIHTSFFRN